MIRSFIAFELPEVVIDSLQGLQSVLKKHGLDFKWVRPGNIHLTLKFLGDISLGDVPAVKHVIRDVAQRYATLSLKAGGLGAFPSVKKARVLWTGIHGDVERLKDLKDTLDSALADMGFKTEKRPFRGHLTLGRAKGRVDVQRLVATISEFGSFASPPLSAERLILFKSSLKPSGAVYTELAAGRLAISNESIRDRTD
jgi:2'-5' RNA ligase